MLAWAFGRLNPFIKLLKNNAFKDDAGRANRVVRHGYIHDPGIQQEPSFQQASSVERPLPGGENRTAGRASHHEELSSDWVVSPPVWATGLSLIAVWGLHRCNASGAAMDACSDTPAWARRAARAADGGVVYVPRALSVSPRAPRIHAQRGARCDPYNTHNCLPPKKLRREIQ